jgi:hypothetical protein
MVAAIEPGIADAVATLRKEYADELASGMAPCQHCRTQKYETYLLLTVLRRAFVRAETRAEDA